MEETVYVAMGSNEGERELNLLRALAEIGKLPLTRITCVSGFYESEPVGPVPQGDFYNAVARLTTQLSPNELLAELQRIEAQVFRRRRTVSGGPRPMDLDLLLYGDRVIDGPDLVIPHPRLHERRFVLEPLAEIAPAALHPGLGRTAAELLAALPPGERVTKI